MKRRIAEQIVNDIGGDLPDGAYFAMIDELEEMSDHFFNIPKKRWKTVQCPNCGKKFATTQSLDQHIFAKHPKKELP